MKRVYNAVINYLVAVVSGRATLETQIEREATCAICPLMVENRILIFKYRKCGVCSCPIKQKIKYKYSECPEGKW